MQNLEAADSAVISVAEGRTMRVGKVADGTSVTLSGGGAVAFTDGAPVTSQAQLAADPSVDFDASDKGTRMGTGLS